jgi:hypothetical protein
MANIKQLKYIWVSLLLVVLVVSQLISRTGIVAAAPTPCGHGGEVLYVTLKGTTDPSQYHVSGTQYIQNTGSSAPDTNPLTFEYKSSACGLGSGFVSSRLLPGGETDACLSNSNSADITVKDSSGQVVGSDDGIDTCVANEGGEDYNLVPITVSSTPVKLGSISGTIEFHPYIGQTEDTSVTAPFNGSEGAQGTGATGQLTGSGSASCTSGCSLDITAQGYFDVINLKAGTYTLIANYNPILICDPADNSIECSPGDEGTNQTITITAGENDNLGTILATQGGSATPSGGGGSDSGTVDCAANPNSAACNGQIVVCNATFGNPISWFVCPVITSIQEIMSSVGSTITNYLTIPSSYFSISRNNQTGQAMYQAWSSVRDIALSLLAIVALVMVISQALSFGPFDAYTVKKVLPRLIIAAILITLSWPLIGFAIGVSNGLGDGIRYLIYAPFQHLQNVNFTIGNESLAAGLGVGAALGLFGMLTLGLMAVLALLTGLFIIVLRQIIVILLAILSPIALVLYVLPGTEKAWKMWWSSFWGALIMFPLIEAFIALGSVFSKIASSAGSTGILDKIIAYIAIYLPYFLLPMTVRFAGSTMQAVGGVVTRSGSKIQGGLSKRRAATAAANRHELLTGQHFNERTHFNDRVRIGQRLNRIAAGVGAGPRGWLPNGRGQAARKIRLDAAVAEFQKNNAGYQSAQIDPGTLGFVARYENGHQARQGALASHGQRQLEAHQAHDNNLRNGMSMADANLRLQEDLANSDTQLQRDYGSIDNGEAMGWNRVSRIAAFQRLGQMGGIGFRDSADVRAVAQSIAGGDNATLSSMVSNFEFAAARQGGATQFGRTSEGASAHQAAWERWKGSEVRTHMVAPPDTMRYYTTEFTRGLGSSDMNEVQHSLEFFAEAQSGKSSGGAGAEVVNEALNNPATASAISAAYARLNASMRTQAPTAATRPVYGPLMQPRRGSGHPRRDPNNRNQIIEEPVEEPVINQLTNRPVIVQKSNTLETAEELIARRARTMGPPQNQPPPNQPPQNQPPTVP